MPTYRTFTVVCLPLQVYLHTSAAAHFRYAFAYRAFAAVIQHFIRSFVRSFVLPSDRLSDRLFAGHAAGNRPQYGEA